MSQRSQVSGVALWGCYLNVIVIFHVHLSLPLTLSLSFFWSGHVSSSLRLNFLKVKVSEVAFRVRYGSFFSQQYGGVSVSVARSPIELSWWQLKNMADWIQILCKICASFDATANRIKLQSKTFKLVECMEFFQIASWTNHLQSLSKSWGVFANVFILSAL